MALSNVKEPYKFNSHQNVLDFISPLIVEGYPVVIQTVFMGFPREGTIDHYEVTVGEKDIPIKVYVKAEREEHDEN